ncbi:solute carrier family 23 member 2-like isoform X1 [Lates japonicus]|uniref:Solute carrier family 23 member 2-like isoform X1 n=1 Tax=Lates japonicus TaxID=270547 RepID=A0AAD3MMT4_LATJO|nr:solute carrier family 23 member 2-like isoform X1 [Lates japonicus]
MGQWGMPTVSVSSVLGMMAKRPGIYHGINRLTSMLAAWCSSAPTHAINRGIAVGHPAASWRWTVGNRGNTTSYNPEHRCTRHYQRLAADWSSRQPGILMTRLGIFGKFGPVFYHHPRPVIGGMFLRYVWHNRGSGDIQPSGIKELDQVIVVLFTTHMFIGGFFGFILDNTIPGTDKERGIKSWRDKVQEGGKNVTDQSCYDIPFCNGVFKRFRCFQYLPFLPSYKTTQQGTSK